jgi:hypothetical protein
MGGREDQGVAGPGARLGRACSLGPAGRASLQSLPVALNDRMLVVDEIEDRSVQGHALSTGTALAKPVHRAGPQQAVARRRRSAESRV